MGPKDRAVNAAPRISVLISSYRNARFVAKKLAEIQAQTWFAQAEFLFIETASPERERDLFAPFCRAHPNCRLITSDERKTLYEAWNMGWNEARAPIICYSNMDDAMHPRLLEEVVAAMERRRWDACSVLIAKQPVDEQWNSWARARLRRLPLSLRPGPFTAWRTELKEKIGAFDGRFVAAGDKDFWSRLLAHRLRLGLVKKILYLYTQAPGEQLSKSPAGQAARAQDARLLAEKTYPIRWSARLRWQIILLRYLARAGGLLP